MMKSGLCSTARANASTPVHAAAASSKSSNSSNRRRTCLMSSSSSTIMIEGLPSLPKKMVAFASTLERSSPRGREMGILLKDANGHATTEEHVRRFLVFGRQEKRQHHHTPSPFSLRCLGRFRRKEKEQPAPTRSRAWLLSVYDPTPF